MEARVVNVQQVTPPVRIVLGREEVTVRDSPLVRAAAHLLQVLDRLRDATGKMPHDDMRSALMSIERFARCLLGQRTSDEVIEGFVYVVMLHLMGKSLSSDSD